MSAAALGPPKGNAASTRALKGAAGFWFLAALVGQWAFLYYLVSFYGVSTLTGNFPAWTKNTFVKMSYVRGDTVGNIAFGAHALLAAVIAFGGAIQLVPQIRKRALGFHRWMGRIFFVTALGLSVSGLYMIWVRHDRGNFLGAAAITLNGTLIVLFSLLAWRAARRREVAVHRRWALRAYLVANAQWFTRVGVFAWIAVNGGPVGIGPNFDGPFITFWGFGCYLVPLAVLELYLRAKESPRPRPRFAMAGGLVVATLLMAVGTFVFSMLSMKILARAHDPRKSIAELLAATIEARGIDDAALRYRELKAAPPAGYNFDESELDDLGYRLLHSGKVRQAVRIFELNVEAFPRSSNVYDSLGEAYMNDGDRPRAIAYYQESLRRNPKNLNAVEALKRLEAR